jgi:hypothetical protein
VRAPAGAWFDVSGDTRKGAVLRQDARRVVDTASVPDMVVAGAPCEKKKKKKKETYAQDRVRVGPWRSRKGSAAYSYSEMNGFQFN